MHMITTPSLLCVAVWTCKCIITVTPRLALISRIQIPHALLHTVMLREIHYSISLSSQVGIITCPDDDLVSVRSRLNETPFSAADKD